MTQQISLRPRALAPWGLRIALAGAAGWLGYLSILHSAAMILPIADTDRAHRLSPSNGVIAARYAQNLLATATNEAGRAQAVRYAEKALASDGLAVGAYSTLAGAALKSGDGQAAEALVQYAQRLSRRDYASHLLAAQFAGLRDDIPTLLHHYDLALRTKEDAPDQLFPLLGPALADDGVRGAMVAILIKQPAWANAFLIHVMQSDGDPAVLSTFIAQLRAASYPISPAINAAVVQKLVTALPDAAWDHYAATQRGAQRHLSRDPRFTAAPEAPTAFDWQASTAMGITAAILPEATNGYFDFYVAMGHGGPLLQQRQMLPAGSYILQGRSSHLQQPAHAQPYILLRCQSGAELLRLNLPNSAEANGRFQARFTVPANCSMQNLSLVARSTDDVAGVTGQIDELFIRPANNSPTAKAAP